MYFDSDMSKLLQRYVGRQVTVQTHGYSRIIGHLASVHETCIRLVNVIRLHELEDSRWYGEIERQQQEELDAGDAETLIATHAITSVSCAEYPGELVEDPPEEPDEREAAPVRTEEPVSEDSSSAANLYVGAGLTALLANDSSELDRVKGLRRDIREQLGFTIPKVRVRDDFSLESCGYRFLVGGVECARGDVRIGKLLSIQTDDSELPSDGEATEDPVFGIPACWIDKQRQTDAEADGCTVVDIWSVIITHMGEAVRRNAASLFSYEETTRIVQSLRDVHPSLINDHFTDPESVLRLHRIMAELLEDGVSISPQERIATAVAQSRRMKEEPALLHVRRALIAQLQASVADADGAVKAAAVSVESQRRVASEDITASRRETDSLLDEIRRAGDNAFQRSGRLAVVVDAKYFHAARKALAASDRCGLVVTSEEARGMSRVQFVSTIGRGCSPSESNEEFKSAAAAVAKPR